MSYDVLPAVSSSMTPACACCAPVSLRSAHGLNRRGFLNLGAAGVAGAALASMAPGKSFAGGGNYEAMLINCIDPRFTTLSWQYMGLIQGVSRDKLEDNYSHFVMAGGPIGAVHPKFAAWHATYWDNLDITVSLHHIKRVIGISHRDCGAAKLAFGAEAVADKEKETESHSEALAMFRQQVNKRHPKLSVITGIMDTHGRVDLMG
jgi:hypothetical protein